MDHNANIQDDAEAAETVRALRALVVKHERRLEKNPDFRAIQSLTRSIQDLLGASTPLASSPSLTAATPIRANGKAALSQSTAARQIILGKGEPVPSPELLEGVLGLGAHVGGENKQRNLGSMLSSNKGFKSVPWKGGTAWWVTDRPLPKGDSLV